MHAHAFHRIGGGVGEVHVKFGEGPAQGIGPGTVVQGVGVGHQTQQVYDVVVQIRGAVHHPGPRLGALERVGVKGNDVDVVAAVGVLAGDVVGAAHQRGEVAVVGSVFRAHGEDGGVHRFHSRSKGFDVGFHARHGRRVGVRGVVQVGLVANNPVLDVAAHRDVDVLHGRRRLRRREPPAPFRHLHHGLGPDAPDGVNLRDVLLVGQQVRVHAVAANAHHAHLGLLHQRP